MLTRLLLLVALVCGWSACDAQPRVEPPLTIKVYNSYRYEVAGVEMERSAVYRSLQDALDAHYNPVTQTGTKRIEIFQIGHVAGPAAHDLMLHCQEIGLNHVIMRHGTR